MISSLESINPTKCSIAFQYGKRLIINKKDAIIHKLRRDDIIEIIDVDPVKNIIVYLKLQTCFLQLPHHEQIDVRVKQLVTSTFIIPSQQ